MSRHPIAAAALAVLALVPAVWTVASTSDQPDDAAPSVAQPSPTGARSAKAPVDLTVSPPAGSAPDGPAAADQQQARPATPDVPPPVRVSVPRLGIDSALDPLGTDDAGRLEDPPRWQVAGWYADGVHPGGTGPAVIAGHVDSPTGPAVFARLSEVRAGDVIRVTRRDGGTVRFEVDRTVSADRRRFPTQQVYGPSPGPALRLITCDGPYDKNAGGYQHNLIVFAHQVQA